MSIEDQMIFQKFGIKGYDFEKATETPILATFRQKMTQTTSEGVQGDCRARERAKNED